jgi:hypothetical protein
MGEPNLHEWLSYDDPDEERTWLFDLTFLASGWNCIYNAGCQGVLTGPAPERAEGCCSYGAHFVDRRDVARVEAAAKKLSAEQWQFRARGRKSGVTAKRGKATTTRLVDDACIFLNRPGFPGGPGCALHRAALERGVAPMTLKPDVCWQLPLRREDTVDAHGHVTSTVTEWDRRHWGPAGDEFHWWCTEAPEAFGGRRPVYLELADELRALTTLGAYAAVSAYLDDRLGTSVLLPHPTLRRRTGANPG